LRRVHRTFWERFRYLAIYQCRECDAELRLPRPYQYQFESEACCPRCGSTRLRRLPKRDTIEKMQSGLLNLWRRLRGGRLLYCRSCRLQFYDRRPVASKAEQPAGQKYDAASS
jgi:DNA-directed RNA polymerase subunit RPC12/RpoP